MHNFIPDELFLCISPGYLPPFLCPGVVYQSGTKWPVASLCYSQVQSGTGSNSGLLTLPKCQLSLHVAQLLHYQNQRGHAVPRQPELCLL